MEDKIIIKVNPFATQQEIYVIKEGQIANKYSVKELNNMPEDIINYCSQHELYKVELAGPSAFVQKIGKRIKEKEILKYKKSEIRIEII